jgi:hypothetical protein
VSQKYAAAAVATFVRIMGDANAPASAKVAAGQALLKVAKEGIELDDLAERVEVLERAASRKSVKALPHKPRQGRDGDGIDDEEGDE